MLCQGFKHEAALKCPTGSINMDHHCRVNQSTIVPEKTTLRKFTNNIIKKNIWTITMPEKKKYHITS